jgi:hypothetical protein
LSRYGIGTAAPREAVISFLSNIAGRRKEIFLALFDLFEHLEKYNEVRSNNTLHYSGSPSSIIGDIPRVYELEKSLGWH